LYKRVFPHWTFDATCRRPLTINKPLKVVSMETIEEREEPKEGAAFALFD